MPKICYVPRNFKEDTLLVIDAANAIIDDYVARGLVLTVRQLYYQMVARNFIANKPSEYSRLASIIDDGRKAGLIDWSAIEDRTRNVRSNPAWTDSGHMVKTAARWYHMDMWANQKWRPEVWIEKDALLGVIENVCRDHDVPFFACRGYSSQSEQWAAGQRMLTWRRNRQMPIILHLGDHDPSGIDMTRDNADRVSLFAGFEIQVVRLALTITQVRRYNLPPNPAKATDSRFNGYSDKYGDDSWELDALDPNVIVGLIAMAIGELKDEKKWKQRQKEIERERKPIQDAANRWADVQRFLKDRKR